MTPQEFITWAEGYYGAYPEGQMNDVFNYLKSWEPLYIEALKRVTILNHSSQFKTPPDIAVMNKLYPQASAEQDKIQRNNGPRPLPDMNETDAQKAARLHADMEYCDVTMQTPGWFVKVLQYRIDRGDYGPSLRKGEAIRWTP